MEKKYITRDESGVARCECGAEVAPSFEKCPRCGAALDATFADQKFDGAQEVLAIVREAVDLGVLEATSENTVLVKRTGTPASDWKLLSVCQYAAQLLEDNGAFGALCNDVVDTKRIRRKGYGRYQLRWMLSQGESISSLFDSIADYAEDAGEMNGANVKELLGNWELESGFRGNLWVCFDEFLGAEYLDFPYMLTQYDGEDRYMYIQDYCRLTHMLPGRLYITTRNWEESVDCIVDPMEKRIKHLCSSTGSAPPPCDWVSAEVYLYGSAKKFPMKKEKNYVWRIDATAIE